MRVLAKCNDIFVPKLAELASKGIVKAGDAVVNSAGKRYVAGSSVVYTQAENKVGFVKKIYRKNYDGEWDLVDRQVSNARGSYRRGIDDNSGHDFVSLGSQQSFVRVDEDTYIQGAYQNFPARIATSDEIEAAIDYIKGVGSAENYKKLVRNYNR